MWLHIGIARRNFREDAVSRPYPQDSDSRPVPHVHRQLDMLMRGLYFIGSGTCSAFCLCMQLDYQKLCGHTLDNGISFLMIKRFGIMIEYLSLGVY